MAIDLQALKDEITGNPASLPYPAFTAANDAAIADVINNVGNVAPRTVDKDTINAADFVAATTFGAYDGLTASETAYYDMIVGRDTIAVTADTKQNWAALGGASIWATADKSTMEPRIAALMQYTGSRAQEIRDTLGVSFVTPSDVASARQLP